MTTAWLRGRIAAQKPHIISAFVQRLKRQNNPLAAFPEERLERIVGPILDVLESGDPSRDSISEQVGRSRAQMLVNPMHSLEASAALFDSVADVLAGEARSDEVPTGTCACSLLLRELQDAIHRRVTSAAIPYASNLLGQISEAQANERNRIARDLHDRSAHALALALQQLEIRQIHLDGGDGEEAEAAIVRLKQQLRESVDAVRNLAEDLGTTYTLEGLASALGEYIDAHGQGRAILTVEHPDKVRLIPTWVQEPAYLAVREATRNALVHSGADRITVLVTVRFGTLIAQIQDNGRGLPLSPSRSASSGTGMRSLTERISQIGGTASVTSTAGTTIELMVPLP